MKNLGSVNDDFSNFSSDILIETACDNRKECQSKTIVTRLLSPKRRILRCSDINMTSILKELLTALNLSFIFRCWKSKFEGKCLCACAL